jgi:hypothetical protein
LTFAGSLWNPFVAEGWLRNIQFPAGLFEAGGSKALAARKLPATKKNRKKLGSSGQCSSLP